MPTFVHQGINFHYEQSGEGETLVFCHGLTSDASVVKALLGVVPGYRLLVWDCRGHGRTFPIGPTSELRFATLASDLQALVAHLGIRRAIVGGVSMGAAIATRFAIERPELVKGLVLVRPAWLTESSPESLRLFEMVGAFLDEFGTAEGRRRFAELSLYKIVSEIDPGFTLLLMDLFDRPQMYERREVLRQIPKSCPVRDWREVAPLMMPSLVIGNEPDYVHPLSYAREWARRLPKGQFVQVCAKSEDEVRYGREVQCALSSFLQVCQNPSQNECRSA